MLAADWWEDISVWLKAGLLSDAIMALESAHWVANFAIRKGSENEPEE